MKTQQIKAKIAELAAQAKALQNQIDGFELDSDDYVEQYDEMLDEVHGDFLGMNASYILKNMDQTAYRSVLLDYLDNLDQDEEKMKNDDYAELTVCIQSAGAKIIDKISDGRGRPANVYSL